MKRDQWQRRAYAWRRMSLAVDRVILKRDPERASRWVNVWAVAAGVRARSWFYSMPAESFWKTSNLTQLPAGYSMPAKPVPPTSSRGTP